MTNPKQTPGQAAREAYEMTNAPETHKWNAAAAAAISAARESEASGDKPYNHLDTLGVVAMKAFVPPRSAMDVLANPPKLFEPTPPATTLNEREHCEKAAVNIRPQNRYADDVVSVYEVSKTLLSERAAAFAQGDAQGYERGLKHAAPIQRQAETDHVRALNAERRFALAAAARLARAVLDDTHASNEEMLDAIHVLDAALGPAPAPEEKL